MSDEPAPTPDPIRYLDLNAHDRRREALRVTLTITVVWVLLFIGYFVAPLGGIFGGGEIARAVVSIAVLVFVSAWQIRTISRSRMPQSRAVISVATIAALLIVGFASIYVSLSHAEPSAFSELLDHVAALYFTVTTLSSVGFGDIAPISHTARIIASVQMLFDLILLGGIVRLLATATRRSLARADHNDESDV